MPGSRVVGLLQFMLLVLAIMVFWNFLIRQHVAKHPESAAMAGLAFDL